MKSYTHHIDASSCCLVGTAPGRLPWLPNASAVLLTLVPGRTRMGESWGLPDSDFVIDALWGVIVDSVDVNSPPGFHAS